LKPENILLLEKNGHFQAKIADFGLSAQITSSAASKRNSKGGTSIYFSPERGHGDKYDEKVDMWALGCISIEMVLEQRLADPIWSDRPDVKTKREKLIDDTEQKHSALGKLIRKLLCQEANERISALQCVSVLSEVIFL
jgi:serine/threonine protein kinase